MTLRTLLSIAGIAGRDVTLRRPRDGDEHTIAGYLDESGDDAWHSGFESAEALYAEYVAGWHAPDEPNRLGLTVIIARSDNDDLVGVLHVEPNDRVLHVGYGVAPQHRRHGVASDALARISSWALGHGFDSVELEIGEENQASQGVARRCGFTPTSRIRSQSLPDGCEWLARAWIRERH